MSFVSYQWVSFSDGMVRFGWESYIHFYRLIGSCDCEVGRTPF